MFQYMRLLGYPGEKITILATYNGQKNLIRDVIAQRCRHPIFGKYLLYILMIWIIIWFCW